ncbi:MAG: rRNA maturation RNase YbeY [Candidatus Vogelbacteria bacterium]|nr:rRNA maturation RNase YbeY [Candidatus Vogelbacteria bacterium]
MVSLRKLAGVRIPTLPYSTITDEVIGGFFDLSIVFVSSVESRRLNLLHRGIDSSTNVLSFPLDHDNGELVFDYTLCMSEAESLHIDEIAYLTYLLIHGLLHLSGYNHGKKMKKEERKFVDKYCKKDNDLIAEVFL